MAPPAPTTVCGKHGRQEWLACRPHRPITAIAFDGQTLASAGRRCRRSTLGRFATRSGESPRCCGPRSRIQRTAAPGRKATRAACCNADAPLTENVRVPAHDTAILAAISPDNQLVATAGGEGRARPGPDDRRMAKPGPTLVPRVGRFFDRGPYLRPQATTRGKALEFHHRGKLKSELQLRGRCRCTTGRTDGRHGRSGRHHSVGPAHRCEGNPGRLRPCPAAAVLAARRREPSPTKPTVADELLGRN